MINSKPSELHWLNKETYSTVLAERHFKVSVVNFCRKARDVEIVPWVGTRFSANRNCGSQWMQRKLCKLPRHVPWTSRTLTPAPSTVSGSTVVTGRTPTIITSVAHLYVLNRNANCSGLTLGIIWPIQLCWIDGEVVRGCRDVKGV